MEETRKVLSTFTLTPILLQERDEGGQRWGWLWPCPTHSLHCLALDCGLLLWGPCPCWWDMGTCLISGMYPDSVALHGCAC